MTAQTLKIAYIEIDTHAEIAENFWELTHDSLKFSVDYYFSDKILHLLHKQPDKNIFRTSASSLFRQLSTQHYDLVIIGTYHRYFNVFIKIAERFPTAIIEHNLNFTKLKKWNLFYNIFKENTKFRIKLLLKEGLLKKNSIYKKAVKTFVLDKSLLCHNHIELPLFFNMFNEKLHNKLPTIVIPGTVSQQRRDYQKVLDLLKKINKPYKIIFLGKAHQQELIRLQNFETKYNKIHQLVYFSEKIPQNNYNKLIKQADILWCPVQEKTYFFSVKETYGVTKISGNIGDAIKYGKWAIFPKKYVGQYPFVLSEDDFFNENRSVATIPISDYYSRENIIKKLEATLEMVIINELKL